MYLKQLVTQVKQFDKTEDQNNIDNTYVRNKHHLDPKIVQKLEEEIMKSMNDGDDGDVLFNSEHLPDSSLQKTGSRRNSTVFDGTESFTMENFTEQVLTSLQAGDNDQNIDIKLGDSAEDHNADNQKQDIDNNKTNENKCCRCSSNVKVRSDRIPLPKKGLLLPQQRPEDEGKICLVLDLDETLVHSCFLAIPHADFKFALGDKTNSICVFVCIRPGAEKFLSVLGNLYEIVIFTASCQAYADKVIDFIDKGKVVRHRLYRESCTEYGGCFVKDLSRLNRNIEKCIIVDNNSVAYMLQPHNAIAVSNWFDDPTDNELFVIMEFLHANYRCENVYNILTNNVNQ